MNRFDGELVMKLTSVRIIAYQDNDALENTRDQRLIVLCICHKTVCNTVHFTEILLFSSV